MKAAIRRAANNLLRRFGFEIVRVTPKPTHHTSPFELQRELVQSTEPVILDVGAYTGGTAQVYRSLFPLARIECFEPFPQSFDNSCSPPRAIHASIAITLRFRINAGPPF